MAPPSRRPQLLWKAVSAQLVYAVLLLLPLGLAQALQPLRQGPHSGCQGATCTSAMHHLGRLMAQKCDGGSYVNLFA